MKPITYWIQNDAINELVNQFGAHLERLSQHDKRVLIALLATREAAKVDKPFRAHVATKSGPPISTDVLAAWNITINLPTLATDRLIEAIAANLHYTPQKTGTPTP